MRNFLNPAFTATLSQRLAGLGALVLVVAPAQAITVAPALRPDAHPPSLLAARSAARATTRPRAIQSATTSANLDQAVLQQINQYRASRNLPALKLDPRITAQALAHSQAMASGQVPFSHNGFQQRVATIGKAIPYSSAAENVAYNMGYSDPATQAVQGWLKSPGHLKNIQGKYNLTGIGVAQNAKGEVYFTQIFIQSR